MPHVWHSTYRNNAGRQWYCLHTTELTEYMSNVANLGAYTCSIANIIIITYNYSCSYSYVLSIHYMNYIMNYTYISHWYNEQDSALPTFGGALGLISAFHGSRNAWSWFGPGTTGKWRVGVETARPSAQSARVTPQHDAHDESPLFEFDRIAAIGGS